MYDNILQLLEDAGIFFGSGLKAQEGGQLPFGFSAGLRELHRDK